MILRDFKLPENIRNNCLSAEFFLNSDNWNVKELDEYAAYCDKSLKCDNCITKEQKILFLSQYPMLRKLKIE